MFARRLCCLAFWLVCVRACALAQVISFSDVSVFFLFSVFLRLFLFISVVVFFLVFFLFSFFIYFASLDLVLVYQVGVLAHALA
jgi:hypothetical protein